MQLETDADTEAVRTAVQADELAESESGLKRELDSGANSHFAPAPVNAHFSDTESDLDQSPRRLGTVS